MQISQSARRPGSTLALLFFVLSGTSCWAEFPDSRFLQDAETPPDTRAPDTRRRDVGPQNEASLDITEDLPDSSLTDGDLPRADLSDGSPVDGSPVDGNPVDGNPLDGDLPKADLPKADLPKADLPKADLPPPDLPKADLPPPDGQVCTPGAFIACIRKLLVRCNTTGDNVVGINCGSASCSAALQRCDECTPTTQPTCQKGDLQICSANGLYVVSTTCPLGCQNNACCTDNDGDKAACDDCDDNDANAFPGQTSYFATPRTSGGYDYDCNMKDEPKFSSLVACTGTGANCRGSGWVGTVPACGQTGQFAACRKVSGHCTQQPPTSRVQHCR